MTFTDANSIESIIAALVSMLESFVKENTAILPSPPTTRIPLRMENSDLSFSHMPMITTLVVLRTGTTVPGVLSVMTPLTTTTMEL